MAKKQAINKTAAILAILRDHPTADNATIFKEMWKRHRIKGFSNSLCSAARAKREVQQFEQKLADAEELDVKPVRKKAVAKASRQLDQFQGEHSQTMELLSRIGVNYGFQQTREMLDLIESIYEAGRSGSADEAL